MALEATAYDSGNWQTGTCMRSYMPLIISIRQ